MFQYKKTVLIFLIMALIFCGGASAAIVENLNVTYHFSGTYINVEAVAPVENGGFFLGMANSSSAILMKTDVTGKEIWRLSLPGENVRTLVSLEDGGAVLATIVRSVNGSEGTGYCFDGDAYIVRVDKEGHILWQRELSHVGVGCLTVSKDMIFFAGWFWETNSGFIQTYLLSTGTPFNDQVCLGSEITPMIPFGMVLEADDTLVLTGGTTSYLTEESAYAWIAKVSNGIVQRQRIIRTGSLDVMYGAGACGYSIVQAHDGGYIVVGSNPPLGVTWASGIGWAVHVADDLSSVWAYELPGCYVPYAIVPFGCGYLIAGMDGYDDPVWLTLSIDGIITELEKISQNGKRSMFNDVAPVSQCSAAIVGWFMPDSFAEGILLTLSDTNSSLINSIDFFGLEWGVIIWIFCISLVFILVVAVSYPLFQKFGSMKKKYTKKSGKKKEN